ncbi:MAG: DUF1289 domain-containing protein [Planktotalea sp.]|uniref:DUF1289 domain-containing protein n=1 Tax=Planktotalea sp. TaxID=2029877 RepID=UPI00031254E1|nr:DUF1289 domain-containing protein [Planktotalea sp.]MBT5822557.1 DUF1289 domain-containing protein [Paracoccaceae bacterium]MDG1075514.1 DUF1289 domain-containing protein [Planktotalea sp.]MDG1083230.1 DUF1289 domain-containing protein [Planktotalea sp.]HCW83946.1 DUF1289 domain-containing protein [Paracoccaceae bacterium]
MSDEIWSRNELDSPCIQICVVHPETRLCTGCNRSIDEISRWSKMTRETRLSIMDELPSRQSIPKGRRGGRAARLKR